MLYKLKRKCYAAGTNFKKDSLVFIMKDLPYKVPKTHYGAPYYTVLLPNGVIYAFNDYDIERFCETRVV